MDPLEVCMELRSAQLLAEWMDYQGLSGYALAARVGRSRQFISMLLRGDKRSCSPETAVLIEHALNVKPGTLFVPRAVRPPRRGLRRPPVSTVPAESVVPQGHATARRAG